MFTSILTLNRRTAAGREGEESPQHDMRGGEIDTNGRKHVIYPRRYFDASPTWFQWNKLTASDVLGLREEPGFEGQHVYFNLNHPIRYIRLVGLVVDIELTKGGKYLLISLDDSSGACIEIKAELRERKPDDLAEYPSNTFVDNLDVTVNLSTPHVYVDRHPLSIGTVIKVKGTIDSFRGKRQLKLERIWVVKDTNEEAKAWAETAQWKQDVLSRSWVLTESQRQEIDAQLEREALKEREREKKRKLVGNEYAAKKAKKLEKREEKRRRDEAKLDQGALPHSHVLPSRVTDG